MCDTSDNLVRCKQKCKFNLNKKNYMKYKILTASLLFSLTLISCKKNVKTRNVISGVNWTLNSKTYVANTIQLDFQETADGYYEVDAVADDSTETSELRFGITNGASSGNHSVPTYWVYCSIYDKSTLNKEPYVFETYNLNISSVFSSLYVSGTFTADKILGPTLACTFTDIKSTP